MQRELIAEIERLLEEQGPETGNLNGSVKESQPHALVQQLEALLHLHAQAESEETRSAPSQEHDVACTLRVDSIGTDLTADSIQAYFVPFGQVVDVHLCECDGSHSAWIQFLHRSAAESVRKALCDGDADPESASFDQYFGSGFSVQQPAETPHAVRLLQATGVATLTQTVCLCGLRPDVDIGMLSTFLASVCGQLLPSRTTIIPRALDALDNTKVTCCTGWVEFLSADAANCCTGLTERLDLPICLADKAVAPQFYTPLAALLTTADPAVVACRKNITPICYQSLWWDDAAGMLSLQPLPKPASFVRASESGDDAAQTWTEEDLLAALTTTFSREVQVAAAATARAKSERIESLAHAAQRCQTFKFAPPPGMPHPCENLGSYLQFLIAEPSASLPIPVQHRVQQLVALRQSLPVDLLPVEKQQVSEDLRQCVSELAVMYVFSDFNLTPLTTPPTPSVQETNGVFSTPPITPPPFPSVASVHLNVLSATQTPGALGNQQQLLHKSLSANAKPWTPSSGLASTTDQFLPPSTPPATSLPHFNVGARQTVRSPSVHSPAWNP